jgi:hypothetical protein
MVLSNGRLCEERVILGIRPSSSCWSCHLLREEFLSAPILSPLSGLQFGPSSGIKDGYGSLGILTSLRSKDGVPGTGFGSSALQWKNYQMWQRQMAVFLRGKGQILWDVTVDATYVCLVNFLAPGSSDMHDTTTRWLTTCFVLCVNPNLIWFRQRT